MVTQEEVDRQLRRIGYDPNGWGRGEMRELKNILMPDEEIEECVNGYYEAGFALLVATKHRVLLVDKKPLNYLTVEDMRFDMISEFDYSHRVIGAHASISSGSKTLQFDSLNQKRLRSLLTYVQTRMTEIKKTLHEQQETQQQHLEQMNEQLRRYLLAAEERNRAQQFTGQGQVYQPVQQPSMPLPPPQPQWFESRDAFERAATQIIDTNAGQVQAPSTLQRLILTPQQVGMGAIRRVGPMLAAYSRVPSIDRKPRFGRRAPTGAA